MPAGDSALYSAKCSESGQQERVEARRRARRLVARLDVDERVFGFGDPELMVDVVGLERRARHTLAERGDRLGRDADARFVGGGQEERPQERTVDSLAEGQLFRAHRRGEGGREPRRQFFVGPKQRVPVADRDPWQAIRLEIRTVPALR